VIFFGTGRKEAGIYVLLIKVYSKWKGKN